MILPWLPFFPQQEVLAIPQFDARFGAIPLPGHEAHTEPSYGLSCADCHVNPTGGGMRNQHGREFSIEQLPIIEKTEAIEKTIEAAQINQYLSIGTDLRFAYLRAAEESTGAAARYKNSFFPMQADLYIAFTPSEHLTLYYQDGVAASGSRETFVLVDKIPFNAHLKFGRFIPPYGLKLDDHTSFIREKLGFGATGFGQDAGVEVGFGERHWFGNAAIFNGSGSSLDDNRAKGVSVTSGFKSPLFYLAGSYFHNETKSDEKTYAGGYSAFHLRRLTLLGEWDRTITEKTITEKMTKAVGSAAYAELDLDIIRGIVAKLKYDGYDPNRDISNDELTRITFGLDLYPYPFTEVLIQYRRNLEHPALENDQWFVMIHLFF